MRTVNLAFWGCVALLGVVTGCRSPDPGTLKSSLQHGGLERTYVYHVPASAPASGSRMLILSLHGRGGSGAQQEDMTALSTLSESHGFLVVYPDGIDRSWADGRGTSSAETQGVDDVGFISALIDEFVANEGVDPNRVFVSGHSNGGMMTNRLGCELSEKIAAIAPVASEIAEAVSAKCSPTRPMSVLTIHGTEDAFVPYLGGEVAKGSGGKVLSAKDARAFWAGKAGCGADAITTKMPDLAPDDGTTVSKEESQTCKDGAEVVLLTVTGGGHTWPGSPDQLGEAIVGKSSLDIVASALHIAFFEKHPRL